MYKKGSKEGSRPHLWVWPALMSWGYTVYCLLNKILSCNQVATLVCRLNFCCDKSKLREGKAPDTSFWLDKFLKLL